MPNISGQLLFFHLKNDIITKNRGSGSVVEFLPSKQAMRVRFPSPAQVKYMVKITHTNETNLIAREKGNELERVFPSPALEMKLTQEKNIWERLRLRPRTGTERSEDSRLPL